jgi:hypothetical protein
MTVKHTVFELLLALLLLLLLLLLLSTLFLGLDNSPPSKLSPP